MEITPLPISKGEISTNPPENFNEISPQIDPPVVVHTVDTSCVSVTEKPEVLLSRSMELDPYFLMICAMALLVISPLIVFVSSWVLERNKKKGKGKKGKKNKNAFFIKACIGVTLFFIFLALIFLFYLIGINLKFSKFS